MRARAGAILTREAIAGRIAVHYATTTTKAVSAVVAQLRACWGTLTRIVPAARDARVPLRFGLGAQLAEALARVVEVGGHDAAFPLTASTASPQLMMA